VTKTKTWPGCSGPGRVEGASLPVGQKKFSNRKKIGLAAALCHAVLASTNKCLAQSNKPRTESNAATRSPSGRDYRRMIALRIYPVCLTRLRWPQRSPPRGRHSITANASREAE
jgi:hypothetical protein